MATVAQNRAHALDAYISAIEQARMLVVELNETLDTHQATVTPERVHWGHVGDIQDIVSTLEKLIHHQ